MRELFGAKDRRGFFKDVAMLGGAAVAASPLAQALLSAQGAAGAAGTNWKNQMGIELFTVRYLLPKDYEGTLAKIAAIGYKEIEPADPYNNHMDPKAYKAMLDRHGLTMPSTHSGATEGPGLEKELEGFQIMGLKYIGISAPNPNRGGGAARAGGAPAPAPNRAGGGVPSPGFVASERQTTPPETTESMKRRVDQLHAHGKIAQKFGMKMLVHNHTQEFAPLADDPSMRPYDFLLQTDPALVALQMDIGWATAAGQNVLQMFRDHPGRFELWHVKDMHGPKYFGPGMPEAERQRNTLIVPVGLGEIDYKTIFAHAQLAGMKHFAVEQDTAGDWGDAILASKVCYDNLLKAVS